MKQHKWWKKNKEKIRQRIIETFELSEDFKL
jgi:hypothetical protein